ncbi:MAG: single-stranded-DNA-specific exonuclease RecJ [Chloroflexi bacterium]|nr:single-stranded-DNA-specific exonuclease RecJ [Chloroflexota bacterium]
MPRPVPHEQLTAFPKLPPFFVQLLYNRGITSAASWELFAAADERLQHDPLLLPDIEKALERIETALGRGERIAVYGDFDADGVTATVLLTQGLAVLGANVCPYIPHRIGEGYGLNKAALSGLRAQGIELVITADCGINAHDEVEHARSLGLDVIITDHHSLTGPVPAAAAVVCSGHSGRLYPHTGLAGVGMAYKLLEAMAQAFPGRGLAPESYLDLVALGTIADVAPLQGENRFLVKRGLQLLKRPQRPGLCQMMDLAGLRSGQVDAEAVSFVLAPRINAAGRLDHAMLSYGLLATDSQDEARIMAERLEALNVRRQRLTAEVLARAREELARTGAAWPILVLADEAYDPGVAGLVASKLVEEYGRPAVVIERGSDVSRGSARSIPEFNMVEALSRRPELFIRFGGHHLAAGFTIPTGNLEVLRVHLLGAAEAHLSGLELEPSLDIDAEIGVSALRGETFRLLAMLSPYGEGNRAPIFLTRGLAVIESRATTGNGEHLRLKVRGDGVTWPAIGFRLGHLAPRVGRRVDAVYSITTDRFSGNSLLQLNLLDIAPHGEHLPLPRKAP